MKFFTKDEFLEEYADWWETTGYDTSLIPVFYIKNACEMIYSQVGLIYRNKDWNETNVPKPIKDASMEQMRFMLEHDIPYVDFNKKLKVGSMEVDLNSDYSTLALRILANHGYLYRGNPINRNMGLTFPFGG